MSKDLSNPESFAGPSEHSQQVALFSACAQYAGMHKELEWYHSIPNGGSRGGDKRSAQIQGGLLKAEGLKSGVSDTFLPAARHGYHGLYIEMKAPGKLNGESKEQKQFGAYVVSQGYLYAVFDSWQDAWQAIAWYLRIEALKDWDKRLRGLIE